MKINHISPQENKFVQIVNTIALVPKKLYYYGILPERRVTAVAVVGSRKPTRYGTEVTTKITEDLARHGVVIVSGLALGVDALAHRAAPIAAQLPTPFYPLTQLPRSSLHPASS